MTALNADGVVDNTAGAVTEIVPTSQTIFSAWNLIMVLAVVVVVAFVNAKCIRIQRMLYLLIRNY